MLADLIDSKCTYDGLVRNRCLTACCADNAFNLIPAIMESNVFADKCDAAGYNTLMRAFMRRGQVCRCSELYDEMLQNGVTPTEVTLSVLVEAAVKAGNVTRAWQLLDDFSVYGVAPNRIHYTTLLRGLVMAGEQAEVSKLLQLMESGPASLAPDLITYQSLVKAYADWGDVPSAVRALGQAVRMGLQPDDHMLNTVLYACAVAALKSDDVLRIFDELVGYGLTPSASSLTLLLKALGSTKDWSSAVNMLTTMHQRFGISPEARFYAQLGLACLSADDFMTAKEVHNSMLQNTGAAALVESACAGLLHRCVHCNSLGEAKALAFQSQSCYIKKQLATSLSPCTLPSCASPRLTQYIAENNLDPRCESLLRTIPAQQAEWVMDQGFIISVDPAKGTASARVVGAVQRAKHVGTCWQFYPTEEVLARRFQEFVTLNALDADCISELEKLGNARKQWIMDQAFLVKTTVEEPSASRAIMALCNHCPNLTNNHVDLGALVEEFASVNKLDQRCVRTLKSLPCADVAHVIDQEGMHLSVDWSKGSSSAKVIGMISRLKAGNHR
jgi:pentatricopeptide repeat protein